MANYVKAARRSFPKRRRLSTRGVPTGHLLGNQHKKVTTLFMSVPEMRRAAHDMARYRSRTTPRRSSSGLPNAYRRSSFRNGAQIAAQPRAVC